jgi:hypothetical protein
MTSRGLCEDKQWITGAFVEEQKKQIYLHTMFWLKAGSGLDVLWRRWGEVESLSCNGGWSGMVPLQVLNGNGLIVRGTVDGL